MGVAGGTKRPDDALVYYGRGKCALTKRPDDALVLITAETDQNQLRRRGTTAPCLWLGVGEVTRRIARFCRPGQT